MFRPILIALICGLTVVGHAQQKPADDNTKTFGAYNGRIWNDMDAAQRPAFVGGFRAGWEARSGEEDTLAGSVIIAMSGSVSNGDLASMITITYQLPENLDLPVSWVLMGNLSVTRGDTSRDIVMTELRKFLATCRGKFKTPETNVASTELSPIPVLMKFHRSH